MPYPVGFDLNCVYASVCLEATGISQGTLLPLTLKTSINTNLVNIFNSTLNAGSLSFVIVYSLEVSAFEI